MQAIGYFFTILFATFFCISLFISQKFSYRDSLIENIHLSNTGVFPIIKMNEFESLLSKNSNSIPIYFDSEHFSFCKSQNNCFLNAFINNEIETQCIESKKTSNPETNLTENFKGKDQIFKLTTLDSIYDESMAHFHLNNFNEYKIDQSFLGPEGMKFLGSKKFTRLINQILNEDEEYSKKHNFFCSLIHKINPGKKNIFRMTAFSLFFLDKLLNLKGIENLIGEEIRTKIDKLRERGKTLEIILKQILFESTLLNDSMLGLKKFELHFESADIFQFDYIIQTGFFNFLMGDSNYNDFPHFLTKIICFEESNLIIKMSTLIFKNNQKMLGSKFYFDNEFLESYNFISQDIISNKIFSLNNSEKSAIKTKLMCGLLLKFQYLFRKIYIENINKEYDFDFNLCNSYISIKKCKYPKNINLINLIIATNIQNNHKSEIAIDFTGIFSYHKITSKSFLQDKKNKKNFFMDIIIK